MKWLNFFSASLVLGFGCLAGAGCKTHTTVVPISGGYEVVSHPHHTLIDDPDPPRLSFQYRAADGARTQIWPSLYTPDTVIQDGLALFIAEKAYVVPDRETQPRLFAVRSPGLPLDLTDEVLWHWSKANGRSFEKTLSYLSEITVGETAGGVQVHLQFLSLDTYGQPREDWPDNGTLQLNWSQVETLVRAVKTKGTERKDLRWHTAFIAEKY